VSSSILMAIVLVVMWLVVLVPMFVRRGEERAETRSMERFSTAMRVLSRRGPSSGGIAGRRRYATAPPAPYADGASPIRTAARLRMLRRRRRTLGVLAATALIGVPAALTVSTWLWLLQVPATVLLVGYVGWLRAQVRREQQRRARRAALFGQTGHPARAGHLASRGDGVTAARPAGASADAARQDLSWRPVPVPSPAYVTATVVRRRTESMIDLDDDDLSFADLEDAADRPRAVNE